MSTELLTKIKADKITAIKSGDSNKNTLLGVLLGEIDRNKGSKEIDDVVVEKTINKMISSINDLISAGKTDAKLKDEITILSGYLPTRIVASREELTALIDVAISNGAKSIKDLMSLVPTWSSGGLTIDRSLIAAIAKEKF